jgi:integrase
MAIRFRDGRKAPWIVYWKNPHTGKTEEEAYATEQEARKENSLIKHRLKFERDTFRREEIPSPPATDTLEACYFLYLQEKKFSKTSLTWSLDSMKPILSVIGDMGIADISRADIVRAKTYLESTGIKPVTVRGKMSVLRTVLRWCADKGIIEQCPHFPKLPPPHYEHFIPPTPEELAALCAAAQHHILRVILLGAQLGVRVGPCELLKMTWGDIDLIRGTARIQAAKKRPSQPWREVPIRDSLLTLMRSWHKSDTGSGTEHIIHYRGQPVGSIQTAWAATLRRAGITRRIRPYDLRHAFATEAIAAGVDVGTVAQLMGHDPKMLLEHYQHVADKQKRAAVEALPDIKIMRSIQGENRSSQGYKPHRASGDF